MFSLEGLLNQVGSGENLSQISRSIGADESATSSAIQAALPMLIGALARNASNPEGAQSLNHALAKDHDGSILGDLLGAVLNADSGPGAGILGHVFGNRQSAVEQQVSQQSGLDMATIGKLLITLAPIVMGALGKTRSEQNLDASGVAEVLNHQRQQIETQDSGLMGMLTGLLDRDHDGSAIDDIAGMIGGFLKNRAN